MCVQQWHEKGREADGVHMQHAAAKVEKSELRRSCPRCNDNERRRPSRASVNAAGLRMPDLPWSHITRCHMLGPAMPEIRPSVCNLVSLSLVHQPVESQAQKISGLLGMLMEPSTSQATLFLGILNARRQ